MKSLLHCKLQTVKCILKIDVHGQSWTLDLDVLDINNCLPRFTLSNHRRFMAEILPKWCKKKN